jgi:ribonucleoside-diphosphate reductase subunit M1
MHVKKRNGTFQEVHLSKIEARIATLCNTQGEPLTRIDPILISQKVVNGLYEGVTTAELDQLAIETCAGMATKDPQYNLLAARIAVSNLHKQTPAKFSEAVSELFHFKHPKTGAAGVLSQELYDVVMANADLLDSAIVSDRDYDYSLFGFKTLERSYLLKCIDKIVERPGYMIMRVALGIHGTDLESALKTYESMSTRLYTHATPTLFNSGTKRPQMSSCKSFCLLHYYK